MCLSLTSFTSVASEGTGKILNAGSPAFVVSPTNIYLFVPYFISKLLEVLILLLLVYIQPAN